MKTHFHAVGNSFFTTTSYLSAKFLKLHANSARNKLLISLIIINRIIILTKN